MVIIGCTAELFHVLFDCIIPQEEDKDKTLVQDAQGRVSNQCSDAMQYPTRLCRSRNV